MGLASLAFSGAVRAAERDAIVQSVDLLVPTPPVVVPIAGRPHLVYELHLTNFLPVDVALSRIQVGDGVAPPAAVRHHVELEVMRETGPVRAEVDGARAVVSADPPVVLGPPLRGGP